MSISLANLQKLAGLKLSTEQMEGVVDVLAVELASTEDRKRKDRERKALAAFHGISTEPASRNFHGISTEQVSRVEDNTTLLPKSSQTVSEDISPSLSKPLPANSRANGTNLRALGTNPREVAKDPIGFSAFWEAYPKRNGSADRKPAVKAFRVALSRTSVEILLHGAKMYAAECRDKGKLGTEFVKQARTWLNADGWTEYSAWDAQAPHETPSAISFPVLEGSDAWQAWKATGRRMPVADLRVDGRVKRGWYFPTEFPPVKPQERTI